MLTLLNLQTVTVTRYAAGSYNSEREYVEGSTSTFEINATIQPLRGEELQSLPEGERTSEQYWVFTYTELSTADETDLSQGDVIEYNSKDFDVVQVETWVGPTSATTHFKARMVRQNR